MDAGVTTRVPMPEPNLKPEDMIARAKALRPKVREEAEAAEQRGYYSEALHREFTKAGFYRCLQPRRFGGYEFDMRTFFKAMVQIASGDPGIGWCLTLACGHALQIAHQFRRSDASENLWRRRPFHRAVFAERAVARCRMRRRARRLPGQRQMALRFGCALCDALHGHGAAQRLASRRTDAPHGHGRGAARAIRDARRLARHVRTKRLWLEQRRHPRCIHSGGFRR